MCSKAVFSSVVASAVILGGCGGGSSDDANADAGGPMPPMARCSDDIEGELYEVGDGEEYGSVGEVPWNTLGPGDTVRIHWRAQPYREKILISTRGEPERPIRVCGVPGPEGQPPVLDGVDATTSEHQRWIEWVELQDQGVIVIARDEDTGYYSRPGYIAVEGLLVRGAHESNSYTALDGSTRSYASGAGCIYVVHGDNITIRGNIITDCGNGLFVLSKSEIEETLSREIFIEGNYLHGNGNVGEDTKHNAYIQALGTVVQFNHFGSVREGSLGGNLKDRSAGTVVRYNWFAGGARMLDLVDAQEHIEHALEDPRYPDAYAYGNTFVVGVNDAKHPIHWGGDTLGFEQNFRAGTLYFFHNTVIMTGDSGVHWGKAVIDAATNDQTVDFRNNVVHLTGTSRLQLMRDAGILELGVNWITSGWVDGSDNFTGAIMGAENLVEGSDPGLEPDTYRPAAGSPVLDRAQALAEEVLPTYDVDMEYVQHSSGVERAENGSGRDLGAFER